MNRKFGKWLVLCLVFLISLGISACGGGGGSDGPYTVTYNGNGNTEGSAPVDAKLYKQGQTVTVLGNAGNLSNTGYFFECWNTKPSGSGTTYYQDDTFGMGFKNVTLYAKWCASGNICGYKDVCHTTEDCTTSDNCYYDVYDEYVCDTSTNCIPVDNCTTVHVCCN
jgi:hypothetical protein